MHLLKAAAFANLLSGISALPSSPFRTATLGAENLVGDLPQNSFVKTCHGLAYLSPQYPPEIWYQATCPDHEGEMQDTIINLNRCIANQNGTMVPASNGKFGKTCQHHYFDISDTQILAVECDAPGGSKRSYIHLDQLLTNDDGQLRCFDNRGCTALTHDCLDEPPWPFMVPPSQGGYWRS